MADDAITPEKPVAPKKKAPEAPPAPPKAKRPVTKPAAAPAPTNPRTEQEYQDELDGLLRRAAAAGFRPEKLFAKSTVKRGVGLLERLTDVVLDAFEGKRK